MNRLSRAILAAAVVVSVILPVMNVMAEQTDAEVQAEFDKYNTMNLPVDADCEAKLQFYNVEGQAEAVQARSEADNSANFTSQTIGQNNQAYDKLASPLEQNNKNMTNLSGDNAFVATVDCPTTNDFLKIIYTPNATGDIQINWEQDLDVNGTPEVFGLVSGVSGVCINGIVKCDAGTYTNCTYEGWDGSSNATLTLVPKNYADMGLCYCTNNSCPQTSTPNYPHGTPQYTNKILGDLGTGMTAVINRLQPKYKVTRGEFSGYTLKYSASDPQNCYNDNVTPNFKPDPNTTTVASQVGDGSSDVFLSGPANTSVAADRMSENSALTMLDTTVGASGGSLQVCERRVSAVSTPIREKWCTPTASNPDQTATATAIGGHSYKATMECAANGLSAVVTVGDAWLNCAGFGGGVVGPWSGTIALSTLSSQWLWDGSGVRTYYTDWFGSDGPICSDIRVQMVASCPTAVLCTYEFYFTNITHYAGSGVVRIQNQGYIRDIINISTSVDTCTQFENNPDCLLYEEKINDVETTWKNGVKQLTMTDNTGNTVPYQHAEKCIQPSGAANFHQICERLSKSGFEDLSDGTLYASPLGKPPYWKVTRQYQCKDTATCDNTSWSEDCLAEEQARLDNVVDNTKENANQFTFSDPKNKSNPGYTDGGTYQPAPDMGPDNCVMACRVKRIATVHTTTEFSDQQNRYNATSSRGADMSSPNQPLKEIRACDRDGGPLAQTTVYNCPFDPGTEEVVQDGGKDCTCRPKDFAEGIAGVQLLEDIVKDFKCTQL